MEFIRSLTLGLVEYMTKRTIYADSPTSPVEPTREMYQQYDSMMNEFGARLLATFINGDKDRKLMVLSAIKDYCVEAEYPKMLLENLFRLLFNSDIIEDTVFIEWEIQLMTRVSSESFMVGLSI